MRYQEQESLDYAQYVTPLEVRSQSESALNVLQYIEENPYSASFRAMLPNFITEDLDGTENTTIFELAIHLCLMGLDAQLIELKKILENDAKSNDEKQQAFLNHLYNLFDVLSEDASLAEHQGSLKKLKKLIHQFARDNGIEERRLFNLEKLKIKLDNELAALSEEEKEKESGTKIRNKLRFILELRSNYPERKFAYITDPRFASLSTELEREERRSIKSNLNIFSLVVSLIVGMGEGLVAAVFVVGSLSLLPALILVGIPGFLCNFYLFRRDSYEILKDIYFGKIWTKPNGEMLSTNEKIFVGASLLFSAGAAAAFGFLSFGSGITGFTALFAAIGITANPIGIMFLAAVIAIVTTIALFTVFSYMTVNWVRNDGPAKLKKKILSLPEEFINFWKHEHWSQLTTENKIKHVISKVITALFNVIFFALAIAAVVLVNIATTGLFKHKAAEIFHTVFHLGTALSNILSYVIIVGLGAVVNSLFYGMGVLKVVDVLKEIVLAVLNPVRTYHVIKANWNSIKESPIRIFNSISTFVKRLFLFGCVAMNSYGQGNGVRHDPVALNWVRDIVHLDPKTVGNINMAVQCAGSGGPNGMACYDATQSPPVVDKNKADSVTQRVQTRASANNSMRLTSSRRPGGSSYASRCQVSLK